MAISLSTRLLFATSIHDAMSCRMMHSAHARAAGTSQRTFEQIACSVYMATRSTVTGTAAAWGSSAQRCVASEPAAEDVIMHLVSKFAGPWTTSESPSDSGEIDRD